MVPFKRCWSKTGAKVILKFRSATRTRSHSLRRFEVASHLCTRANIREDLRQERFGRTLRVRRTADTNLAERDLEAWPTKIS